jgi:hypothetical protein
LVRTREYISAMSAIVIGSVFSDPAWVGVIVGVVAMVVGAAVAIVVGRWQRGPKPITELSYRLSTSKLISTRSGANLRIVLDDDELARGGLATLVVRNTGNQPIPRDAFDGPLELRFESGVRLLRAPVVAAHPASLEPHAEIGSAGSSGPKGIQMAPARLVIRPLSLNPGASFTVEMLVDGQLQFVRKARLFGNIVGVSEPRSLPDEGAAPTPGSAIRDVAVTATSLVGAAVGLVVAVVSFFVGVGHNRSNTSIRLSTGRQICVSEYRVTDTSVTGVQAGSGRLIILPQREILAIRRNTC